MDYNFKVIECENKMKNYFRNRTGKLIKDTIIITIKNTGKKDWAKNQGSFKCLKEKSNQYFEPLQIPQDILVNETREFVLSFPRIKKNFNSGKMICTIQFVYNNQTYNEETIQFTKTFDITGNTVIRVRKEEEERKKKEEEEEEKRRNEELKKYLKPGDEIVEVEGGNDKMSNVIAKFRGIFNLPKEEYNDDYVKNLIKKSDYDFNYAFEEHIKTFENKDGEDFTEDKNKLDDLISQMRKSYCLSEEDFPDDVLEDALIRGKGDLYKSFAVLMDIENEEDF